jgi:hypothetical protein
MTTINHKLLKTFQVLFNTTATLLLLGLTFYKSLSIELVLGIIVVLILNKIFTYNYKKFRTLELKGHEVKIVTHDAREELIDLSRIKSITKTGSKLGRFKFYKIQYLDKENKLTSFITSLEQSDSFTDLTKRIKLITNRSEFKSNLSKL